MKEIRWRIFIKKVYKIKLKILKAYDSIIHMCIYKVIKLSEINKQIKNTKEKLQKISIVTSSKLKKNLKFVRIPQKNF